MTPAELHAALDAIVPAVSADPVVIELGGRLYHLAQVEASTTGRLVLRAAWPHINTEPVPGPVFCP